MIFDIIIVGGGHAGIEASYISSKIVKNVLLITYNKNNIGSISCNPSIGGLGKSHLVKEIDALGGLMAKLTDLSGIQYKILNLSKGKAVQSTRVQIDKKIYKYYSNYIINNIKNITIYEDEVIDLIIDNNTVKGVITNKKKIYSDVVILTTGTFLNSKIFIGKKIKKGGRINDHCSEKLSEFLQKYPFKFGYLKTGTPPRIYKKSINYKYLKKQKNDNIKYISFFSNLKKYNRLPQIKCYITCTNKNTHKIIKDNLKYSPLYNGKIIGKGPRYCPSIEDKIINFPEKNKHNIFLEKEGLFSNIIYPNGISTSLPINIQNKFIKTIYGLENAKIIKPGYAVEYMFFNPIKLNLTLESKIIKNLFFAGQINGTTGYEEAAVQGLIAGINASLKIKNKPSFIPKRLNSYIGVLIDDLCNRGIDEPYRMFTSRSEYRLFLREDNADYRLTPYGYKLKLINKKKWKFFLNKINIIKKNYIYFRNKSIFFNKIPKKIIKKYFLNKYLKKKISIKSLICNYFISLKKIINNFNLFNKIKNCFLEETEILIKYEDYLNKQKEEINKLNFYKKIIIPNNINYNLIPGLSKEIKEKLIKYKLKYLCDIYKISGITPASIISILIYIKKNKNNYLL